MRRPWASGKGRRKHTEVEVEVEFEIRLFIGLFSSLFVLLVSSSICFTLYRMNYEALVQKIQTWVSAI